MNSTRSRFAGRFLRGSSLAALTVAGMLAAFATPAFAAKVSRAVLMEYFQTGDKPTATQFGILIDSMVNISEDRYLLGLRQYDPLAPELGAAVLDAGTLIDSSMTFGPAAGLSDGWAGRPGFLALSFTEGSSPDVHYGYLQIAAGAPGSSDVYPMFVEYFVYEDLANTALSITSVPEPSTLALAFVGGLTGLGLLARRNKAGASVGRFLRRR